MVCVPECIIGRFLQCAAIFGEPYLLSGCDVLADSGFYAGCRWFGFDFHIGWLRTAPEADLWPLGYWFD
jgi:hypothetical protein